MKHKISSLTQTSKVGRKGESRHCRWTKSQRLGESGKRFADLRLRSPWISVLPSFSLLGLHPLLLLLLLLVQVQVAHHGLQPLPLLLQLQLQLRHNLHLDARLRRALVVQYVLG